MADQTLEVDMAGGLQPGEELFGVIVGTDEGARVVWTPRFQHLPREKRLQIGALLQQAADVIPPTQTN